MQKQRARSSFIKSLNISVNCDWNTLKHDYAHSVDLADDKAREMVPLVEDHFKTARAVTKVFRWGKAFHETFSDPDDIEQRCVSITDIVQDDENDDEDDEELIGLAEYAPVLQSNLKFAAHGAKFLNNYIKNIPHYILSLNNRVNDTTIPAKQRDNYTTLLMRVDVKHIALIYHLHDIYIALAKAQHGVSKVNQLPWHYNDRIDHFIKTLDVVTEENYEGQHKEAKEWLRKGEFATGTLIMTEERRKTRQTGSVTIHNEIEEGRIIAKQFAQVLKQEVQRRIEDDKVVKLMKDVFTNFNVSSLATLHQMASQSGKDYGTFPALTKQLKTLSIRYKDIKVNDEMKKWLMICTQPNLYKDINEIIHFALCCFVKAPLEAPAETIGSLINQHGRKQRCSLLSSSLSNEVQIAWNGPAEYDSVTEKLISDALQKYFEDRPSGEPRFFVSSKLRYASSTVANFMKKVSRISFR